MNKNQKKKKDEWEKIRVSFPDGTILENDIVRDTYVETILKLGVQRVFQLKLPGVIKRNILLIDNHPTKEEPYCRDQREIAPGYYLLSYNNTLKKAQLLAEMSEKLNAHLKVEILTPAGCQHISAPMIPSTKQKVICGQVEKADGVWRYNNGDAPAANKIATIHFIEEDDICKIPYSDGMRESDVLAIRHEGKIGIYTLSPIGNINILFPLQWICTTENPFPYDDIRVLGMKQKNYGYIAFCKDGKWGIDKAYRSAKDDMILFQNKVRCEYSSLDEAIMKLWRNPFE